MKQTRTVQLHARLGVALLAAVIAFLIAGIAMLASPSQSLAADAVTVTGTDSVEVELKATKTLEGGTLEADQFEFMIEAVTEGAPMPADDTATNDAEGNISFGKVTYNAAGTYEYKVTEVVGEDETIEYDDSEQTITVKVTAKKKEGSTGFEPTVHVSEGAAMQWLKSYKAEGEEVSYDKGDGLGGAATYKLITDGNDKFHPFCLVEEVSSGTENGQDVKTRHKSNAEVLAGGTYLDSVLQVQNTLKPGVAPSVDKAHVGLQMLFWAGYPYNQANLKGDMSDQEFYKVTQWALWGFMHSLEAGTDSTQRNGSGNTEVYDKLLEYANGGNGANDLWLPESGITMYIYWPAGEGSPDDYQPMINAYLQTEVAEMDLTGSTEPVAFVNTVTSGGGDTPTELTIKTKVNPSEIEAAPDQTFTDTITLSGLTPGVEYTITGKLMDKDAKEEVEATCTPVKFTAKSANEEHTMDFTVDGTNFEGKSLVVFETLSWKEGEETKEKGHTDYNDADQTVTVKTPTPDEGDDNPPSPVEPEDQYDPSSAKIGTSVSVNGVTAAKDHVLNIENKDLEPIKVTDTISYTGLMPGATYAVTAQLMEVVGTDATETGVEQVGILRTADASGKGTWEMDLGEVELAEDTYYVIFEEATRTTNENGEAITGGETLEHKNVEDKAQAINVGSGWENTDFFDNQPPFTPVFDEPLNPTLATSVTAGTSSGTSTRAATLTYTQAQSVKKVTDTVTYSDFDTAGVYSLHGELVDVTDPNNPKIVSEADAENLEATSSTGSWTMDFTNVTLEPGKTYVVFEYAYDEVGNEVANHADVNDKAQTIIVGAKPTLPSSSTATAGKTSTTAKTGDAAGSAVIALALAAVAAVGAAYGARRRSMNK